MQEGPLFFRLPSVCQRIFDAEIGQSVPFLPVRAVTPSGLRRPVLPAKSFISILALKKNRWQELYPTTYGTNLHGLMILVTG